MQTQMHSPMQYESHISDMPTHKMYSCPPEGSFWMLRWVYSSIPNEFAR